MENELKALLNDLRTTLNRFQGQRRVVIANATDYSRAGGFYLYVGQPGNVQYTTPGGDTGTQYFVAGYHPTRFISITGAGTTATDLAACYN